MHEFAREVPRGKTRLRTAELPFSAIPHQSKLFLDYLSDPFSLKELYPNAVASPLDVAAQVKDVFAGYTVDRSAVCDSLIEINEAAGSSAKTMANIERLRDKDCIAVLTGQQAGLFTGPLYTIYKALSAVKMADALNAKGVKAVPIFWAATEDHDLEEVSAVATIANDGALTRVTYDADKKFAGRPVGDVVLDEGIARVVGGFYDQIPSTEFSDNVRSQLSTCWRSGEKFGDAFLKTLAILLGDCGLILVDPMNSGLKNLAAPIMSSAIERSEAIRDALIERGKTLDGLGYHSQVMIENDHVPLFWIDDAGKRVALRMDGKDQFRTKDRSRQFSRAELLEISRSAPERLSAGVMLRPVVQDYVFPSVCYFGGGAEVAYFAQNSEVYRVLERHATAIFHRQSFTVVEPRHRRALDRYRLELSDLFSGHESVSLRLAEQEDMTSGGKVFEQVETEIDSELDRLDQQLSKIDPTVADNLSTRRKKIIYHIGALKNKALRALARKNSDRERQLDSLFSNLLPYGELQERELNVFTFLNKYGPNFIDWVFISTDVEQKDHVILDI